MQKMEKQQRKTHWLFQRGSTNKFIRTERRKEKFNLKNNSMPKKTDNKTIGITIRFFTNDLPGRVGTDHKQIPFWTCGNVHLEANQTKGIKPRKK